MRLTDNPKGMTGPKCPLTACSARPAHPKLLLSPA